MKTSLLLLFVFCTTAHSQQINDAYDLDNLFAKIVQADVTDKRLTEVQQLNAMRVREAKMDAALAKKTVAVKLKVKDVVQNGNAFYVKHQYDLVLKDSKCEWKPFGDGVRTTWKEAQAAKVSVDDEVQIFGTPVTVDKATKGGRADLDEKMLLVTLEHWGAKYRFVLTNIQAIDPNAPPPMPSKK